MFHLDTGRVLSSLSYVIESLGEHITTSVTYGQLASCLLYSQP